MNIQDFSKGLDALIERAETINAKNCELLGVDSEELDRQTEEIAANDAAVSDSSVSGQRQSSETGAGDAEDDGGDMKTETGESVVDEVAGAAVKTGVAATLGGAVKSGVKSVGRQVIKHPIKATTLYGGVRVSNKLPETINAINEKIKGLSKEHQEFAQSDAYRQAFEKALAENKTPKEAMEIAFAAGGLSLPQDKSFWDAIGIDWKTGLAIGGIAIAAPLVIHYGKKLIDKITGDDEDEKPKSSARRRRVESIEESDDEDCIEVDMPEWAAYYLEYDDPSGLDDADLKMVKDYIESMEKEGYLLRTIDWDDRNEFCSHPEFGKACSTVKACFRKKDVNEDAAPATSAPAAGAVRPTVAPAIGAPAPAAGAAPAAATGVPAAGAAPAAATGVPAAGAKERIEFTNYNREHPEIVSALGGMIRRGEIPKRDAEMKLLELIKTGPQTAAQNTPLTGDYKMKLPDEFIPPEQFNFEVPEKPQYKSTIYGDSPFSGADIAHDEVKRQLGQTAANILAPSTKQQAEQLYGESPKPQQPPKQPPKQQEKGWFGKQYDELKGWAKANPKLALALAAGGGALAGYALTPRRRRRYEAAGTASTDTKVLVGTGNPLGQSIEPVQTNEGLFQIAGQIVGGAIGGTLAGGAGADLGGRIMSGAAMTLGSMGGGIAGKAIDDMTDDETDEGTISDAWTGTKNYIKKNARLISKKPNPIDGFSDFQSWRKRKAVEEAETSKGDGRKDIWTLELGRQTSSDGDVDGIDDMKYSKTYESEGDAIEDAVKAHVEYAKDGEDIFVSVLAGEYQLPSGDIYGEPYVAFEVRDGRLFDMTGRDVTDEYGVIGGTEDK